MSTYADLELSAHGGRPVELFRFVHGVDVWTYSSGQEVEYNGEIYAACAVGRDEVGQHLELHSSGLSVLLPRTCELSILYLAGSPEAVVSVTVFRAHVGASDGPIVYWKGRVVSVEWSGIEARLTCESVFTSLKRPGLRARYQRLCRHVLYGRGCALNLENFATPATCTAVSSSYTVLTVPSAGELVSPLDSNAHYAGGMVRTADGALRCIVKHAGASLTLASPLLSLVLPAEITLFPGCAHTRGDCDVKFGNSQNFGGWPWLPLRNPFDGRSIV